MSGVPRAEAAAARARWLAELAEALDEARDLVRRIGVEEARIEAIDLAARIDAVRNDIQTIRLMRSSGGGHDFGPEWTKNMPWRLSA